MRKLVTVFTLILVVTLIFGLKVAPFVEADSTGALIAGADLNLTEGALDLSLTGTYDVPGEDFYLDGLVTYSAEHVVLKVKGSYDTTTASPTIGFLAVTSPTKVDVFSLYAMAGTGDFRNKDFGNKVIGDILLDNKDISALVGTKLGLAYTWFDLDAKLQAGYFIKDSEYEVAALIDGLLFDVVAVNAKVVMLPEFTWSVFAKATFEF